MSPENVFEFAEQLLADVIRAAEEDDDESAHLYEDKLHQYVLLKISEGFYDPKLLAKFALQSQKIKFSRWCA